MCDYMRDQGSHMPGEHGLPSDLLSALESKSECGLLGVCVLFKGDGQKPLLHQDKGKWQQGLQASVTCHRSASSSVPFHADTRAADQQNQIELAAPPKSFLRP